MASSAVNMNEIQDFTPSPSSTSIQPAEQTPSTACKVEESSSTQTSELLQGGEKEAETKKYRDWQTFFPKRENLPAFDKLVQSVKVQIRTRNEADSESSLSAKMYSSLKYILRQEVTVKNVENGERMYPMLFMNIRVVDSETKKDFETVKTTIKGPKGKNKEKAATAAQEANKENNTPNNPHSLTCSSFLKGKIEHALIPMNASGSKQTTTFVSNSKVQFTDVSYRHFCEFHFHYFTPDNLTDPIFIHTSPQFQVFARKQTQQSSASNTPSTSTSAEEVKYAVLLDSKVAHEKFSSISLSASPPKKRLKHITNELTNTSKRKKRRRDHGSSDSKKEQPSANASSKESAGNDKMEVEEASSVTPCVKQEAAASHSSPQQTKHESPQRTDLLPSTSSGSVLLNQTDLPRPLTHYLKALDGLIGYLQQKCLSEEEKKVALDLACKKLISQG